MSAPLFIAELKIRNIPQPFSSSVVVRGPETPVYLDAVAGGGGAPRRSRASGGSRSNPRQRVDRVRYAIAFALMRARKIVRGLKDGLTEDERYAVADHVIRQLKERGDPWHLDDEAKPGSAPTT
jgi:hypothetical protein